MGCFLYTLLRADTKSEKIDRNSILLKLNCKATDFPKYVVRLGEYIFIQVSVISFEITLW